MICSRLLWPEPPFIGITSGSPASPPMQYLQQYRLIRARELLLQGQLSVTTIAVECGFYDGAHLDRVFRKAYGLSPRHYRRECRP